MYAADWFVRAASIPCGLIFAACYLGAPPNSAAEFLLAFVATLAGPVIIAGGWGAWLGPSILDPRETRSAGLAALKGLCVTGASFVTYIFAICFITCISDSGSGGNFCGLFLMLLIGGTIFVGWLLAIVGALAGVLLFRKQGERHGPA